MNKIILYIRVISFGVLFDTTNAQFNRIHYFLKIKYENIIIFKNFTVQSLQTEQNETMTTKTRKYKYTKAQLFLHVFLQAEDAEEIRLNYHYYLILTHEH